MEDLQIIELYWQRSEDAVTETAKKYGKFCYSIAKNVLSYNEDAEECVNDTYLKVWEAIPPQRPTHFRAWLGKIVRNTAINLWNKQHSLKRYPGMAAILDELDECIPFPATIEHDIETAELTAILNKWLDTLPQEDRILFVLRYWNGEAIKTLAKKYSVSAAKMAKRMYNLRQKLKTVLEKEGYSL